MMDSPSLVMATGLSNWPGPSPWEPQASTYSKGGGGAGAAVTVCAGREQAHNISAATRENAGKMPALRTSSGVQEFTFTIALQPSRKWQRRICGERRRARGHGAPPFASGDRHVLLSRR